MDTQNIIEQKQASAPERHLNYSEPILGGIAVCASATFVFGALIGAPWPAAVASCGVSLMGAVVGYFLLKSR